MSHDKTTNDLLCQLVEGQAELIGAFHEHKGSMEARVGSLESAHKWARLMTYVINPALGILAAIGMHFGITVPSRHP